MSDCFVFYDEDKNIKAISSHIESYPQYNFFQIDSNLADEFIKGKKFLEDYFVKHSKLNTFTLEKKHTINSNNVYFDVIEAKNNLVDAELIIKHDKDKKQYMFKLSDEIKELIDTTEYDKELVFYFVKSDQINYILNIAKFRIKELLDDNKVLDFNNNFEISFNEISIFTKKYFEKIGFIQ